MYDCPYKEEFEKHEDEEEEENDTNSAKLAIIEVGPIVMIAHSSHIFVCF